MTDKKRVETELELLKLSMDLEVEERTQEVRESRERYRRLVEGLRDEYLFFATTPEGVLSYVSPSVRTILGYPPEDVIGRNWRDFVDPESDSYAEIEELERLRFAGQSSPPYVAEVRHADGSTVLLETRDVAVRDTDGSVILNEGICKDITARRHAEEELQRAHDLLEERVEQRTAELQKAYDQIQESEVRYRNVVEDNPDFIVRWNDQGLRTFVNEAYCKYLGEAGDQLIGTEFTTSMVEEDYQHLEKRLRALTVQSPVVVHDNRFTFPDGRVAWHRWSHRALFDKEGHLVEYQSVGSDITSRRAAEEHAKEKAVVEAQMENLSPRERDVMRLVVAGDANKVVARKLDLSIKTIEKHRSSLMRKLRIRSVPELVRMAMLVEGEQRS